MSTQSTIAQANQKHVDELIRQIESLGLSPELFVVPGSQLHQNLNQRVTGNVDKDR